MKINLKTAGYGIAALGLFLGRYPISWLLSSRNQYKLKRAKKQGGTGIYIKSPTGNILFVKRHGPAGNPPLVFIHGINSSSEQWQHQQEFFGRDHPLIFVDLPGHGHSPDAADFSITALAKDLSFILSSMNVGDPVLYGHSLGGMIIQEYCRQNHTPLPKAIVLQNCSYTNPLKTMPISPLPWLLQSPLIVPTLRYISVHSKMFTAFGYITYTSGMSSLFYRMLLFNGKQSAGTLRTMCSSAANTKAKATSELLMETFGYTGGRDLAKIKVPCLVLAAASDRLIDPSVGLFMHRQIPGSELAIVAGGHQNLAECPEAVNYVVLKFLRKRTANRSTGNNDLR